MYRKMLPFYKNILQCFFAEFFATGIYIFVGCMGCMELSTSANSNFQISLYLAFVLMTVVQSFGHISGGHLNPVVTVAAYINDVVKLHMVLIYFIAQLCGSIAGYGLLKIIVPSMKQNFCMILPNTEFSQLQIFIVEFIITSVLVLVCCAIWDSRNVKNQDSMPLRIGLTVGCLIFSAINISGAGMNPVRTFGPALWQLNFDYQWIYWVAPLTASVFTSFVYKYCFNPHVDNSISSVPSACGFVSCSLNVGSIDKEPICVHQKSVQ